MIKIFEQYIDRVKESEIKPNFKVGDTVFCIEEDSQQKLKVGNKYIVTDIFNNDSLSWFCTVEEFGSFGFYCCRLVSKQEYEEMKYNL